MSFFFKPLKPTVVGYISFAKFLSNHRALWIDFNIEVTLGSKVSQHIQPNVRILTLRDPRVVNNFQQDCLSFITKHNLINMISSLKEKCGKKLSLSANNEVRYEQIDKIYIPIHSLRVRIFGL